MRQPLWRTSCVEHPTPDTTWRPGGGEDSRVTSQSCENRHRFRHRLKLAFFCRDVCGRAKASATCRTTSLAASARWRQKSIALATSPRLGVKSWSSASSLSLYLFRVQFLVRTWLRSLTNTYISGLDEDLLGAQLAFYHLLLLCWLRLHFANMGVDVEDGGSPYGASTEHAEVRGPPVGGQLSLRSRQEVKVPLKSNPFSLSIVHTHIFKETPPCHKVSPLFRHLAVTSLCSNEATLPEE